MCVKTLVDIYYSIGLKGYIDLKISKSLVIRLIYGIWTNNW